MADLAAADRMLSRMQQLAEEVGTPVLRWMAATYRCARMMVSASGDDIERAAIAAFEIGQESGQVDALLWFAPQLFVARMAQGRLGEIIDLCRQQTADSGLPAWRGGLALCLLRSGEGVEARSIIDDVLRDESDPFPKDLVWLPGHSFVGEVVGAVGTPAQARHEYEVLAPYAGRVPFAGNVAFPGVDLRLATLAVRAESSDAAERHFADADALHSRLDAPIWLAETRLAWGRFLLERERDRALPLLQSARELADRMGAADIRQAADELLASA